MKPMPPVRASHLIQLYEQDEEFSFPVARYLFEGMQRGEGALAIATAEHQAAISRDLRRMVGGMHREQEPVMLDTNEMLPRFMIEGYPDAERFERSVGEAARAALARSGGRGLRVFGDMVGVLWKAGRFPSAIRLEQLWERLLDSHSFSLLCAYPVDLFGKLFDMDILDAVFCAHSHFVPSKDGERLEGAIDRAMEGVLDTRLETFRRSVSESRFGRWPPLPPAEAAILWLRKTLPHKADDVLARARQLYQESA